MHNIPDLPPKQIYVNDSDAKTVAKILQDMAASQLQSCCTNACPKETDVAEVVESLKTATKISVMADFLSILHQCGVISDNFTLVYNKSVLSLNPRPKKSTQENNHAPTQPTCD